MADTPTQITVAVHVHRVWSAENERDRARDAYQAAIDEARAAGISIKGMRAAMRAMKHGRLAGLSADALSVVAAIESVPMMGVEIGSVRAGAFSPTPPAATLTAPITGEAA